MGVDIIQQALSDVDDSTEAPEFPNENAWTRGLSPLHVLCDKHGKTLGKAFVDFQRDVKLSDINQAHSEGHVSVEHLKPYTTSGMAGHPQPHGHPRWGCVRAAPPAKARWCALSARSTVWI
ncbi:hypothetical protein [Primorskyibacter flagellatus]|uniref:hypothetical protein n=1 Tax=Primorskyibacter flagellatus TaxID=1387277 RepID=UPI002E275B3F